MNRPQIPLITGVVLGLFASVYMIFISPFEIGTDFQAYYFAVQAWLSNGSIYAATPPNHPQYHFLYLPATLLWFLPLGILPKWWLAYIVMVLISATAALLFARSLIDVILDHGIELSNIDKILFCAFLLLSTFAAPNLLQGQVNLLLGIAIGAGLLFQQSGYSRRAGLLVGLAATLKLFPAVVGFWFIYKRDWVALLVSILTGITHIALSVAVFGLDTTTQFFTEILPQRFATEGGIRPESSFVTIRRPLSALLGLEGTALSLVALTIGVGIVVLVFWTAESDLEKLLGLLITILIAFPSYFLYLPILLYPLIPLLYIRADWGIVIGTVLLTATFSLEHVVSVLRLSPGEIANSLIGIATPFFSAMTLPLVGCLVLLAWLGLCARKQTGENGVHR
ncbi:glycosyltransferase family 87 protein [Halobacterium salinarum]|uniref:glycosyltransferase family 87 protein n=1 Tax=Halobacterium salinarum TaxID=2242 RepID=UPI00255386D1|nr:glycosyltransferase family 87 protein [Halobacterium salinarum]MDL0138869.1 glycosyltransferase family 87 protein [Halobacterium salinarum]